jgi:hypothetical protein
MPAAEYASWSDVAMKIACVGAVGCAHVGAGGPTSAASVPAALHDTWEKSIAGTLADAVANEYQTKPSVETEHGPPLIRSAVVKRTALRPTGYESAGMVGAVLPPPEQATENERSAHDVTTRATVRERILAHSRGGSVYRFRLTITACRYLDKTCAFSDDDAATKPGYDRAIGATT